MNTEWLYICNMVMCYVKFMWVIITFLSFYSPFCTCEVYMWWQLKCVQNEVSWMCLYHMFVVLYILISIHPVCRQWRVWRLCLQHTDALLSLAGYSYANCSSCGRRGQAIFLWSVWQDISTCKLSVVSFCHSSGWNSLFYLLTSFKPQE